MSICQNCRFFLPTQVNLRESSLFLPLPLDAEDILKYEDNENLPDIPENDDSDTDYVPKKKKIKKSTKIKQEKNGAEKPIKVKREGGKKIGRPKKERPEEEIEESKLFRYIKVTENNKFECQFCKSSYNARQYLFIHLNLNHFQEIKLKHDSNPDLDPVQKYDCEKKMCKKLYGYKRRQLWCEMCTMISKMPKIYEYKQKKKQPELCPECGKYVTNLKYHYQTTHTEGQETCPHCNQACRKFEIFEQNYVLSVLQFDDFLKHFNFFISCMVHTRVSMIGCLLATVLNLKFNLSNMSFHLRPEK